MIRLNKANFAIAASAAVPGDGVPPASTGILVSSHETIETDSVEGYCQMTAGVMPMHG